MQYLFRLLRNNLFGVLSTLLFVFGYWQVMRFNNYHSSFYFNTSTSLTSSLTEAREDINAFFNLPSENNSLHAQNKALLEKLANRHITKDTALEAYQTQYEVTLAKIINGSTQNRNNFFTLNKGAVDNILKGEAVIGPLGVVGIVLDVNDDFSVVMPLINSKFKITPEVEVLNYADGQISWNGRNADFLELDGISKFKPIKEGMNLVTSHYSKTFPPGINIGSIHSLSKSDNSSFFEITVKTATDFHKLSNVYVVKNNYVPMIDTLNQQIIELDAN